jgi:tRNA threonylcarbamoyl adenosine modification protein (Sua5/YciO/YrdC/YwlC family)
MSQYLYIHPDNPQPRLVKQAVEMINKGAVVVFPTDSSYAIGCHLDDKKAVDRIRQIRNLDKNHNFTLVCRDLADVSNYANVDNQAYRFLKRLTPGAYTFILKASREVPNRLIHKKRKEIGLRIPDNQIISDLLASLGQPLMSCTLILPNEAFPVTDIEDVRDLLEKHVDLIIDGGHCGIEPTTVVHLEEGKPFVSRIGKGDVDFIEN